MNLQNIFKRKAKKSHKWSRGGNCTNLMSLLRMDLENYFCAEAEKNLSFREDESKSTIGPHVYFVVPLVPPQWGVHVADMQVKDNLGSHAQRFHWTTKSHQLFRMQ